MHRSFGFCSKPGTRCPQQPQIAQGRRLPGLLQARSLGQAEATGAAKTLIRPTGRMLDARIQHEFMRLVESAGNAR